MSSETASTAQGACKSGKVRRNSAISTWRSKYQKHASVTAILRAKTALWLLLRFRTDGSAVSRFKLDSPFCIRPGILSPNSRTAPQAWRKIGIDATHRIDALLSASAFKMKLWRSKEAATESSTFSTE